MTIFQLPLNFAAKKGFSTIFFFTTDRIEIMPDFAFLRNFKSRMVVCKALRIALTERRYRLKKRDVQKIGMK